MKAQQRWRSQQIDIVVLTHIAEASIKGQCKNSLPNVDGIKCHGCGKPGHIRPNCSNNPRNFKQKTEGKVNFVFQSEMNPQNSIIDAEGKLFKK